MTTLYPPQVDYINSTIGGLQKNPQFVNNLLMTKPVEDREFAAIAARLRAIREAFSDLNQKDWADRHAFNQTQYNNWEKGTRRISVDSAELLADRYGLSLDFIYRGRRDGLSETAAKLL